MLLNVIKAENLVRFIERLDIYMDIRVILLFINVLERKLKLNLLLGEVIQSRTGRSQDENSWGGERREKL